MQSINMKTTNKPLSIENIEIDQTYGQIISHKLAQTQTDDPLRSYELAIKFRDEENLELSESDKTYVRDIIKKSQLFPFITAQILNELK
jgi:hypothetical protein